MVPAAPRFTYRRRALPALLLVLASTLLLGACAGPRRSAPERSGERSDRLEPYRVYTSAGAPAALADVEAAMGAAEAVLIGERHDDAVAHRLEARLLEAAHTRYGTERPVALSLEVFSRDVQYVLDEYLAGLITERHFLASADPWGNYAAAYRPLVEFARAHGLPVIAANAPRRYVNRVARLGPASLEALGERARAALPPLPYPGPSEAYRAKWMRLMHEAGHGPGTQADAPEAPLPEAHAAHAAADGPSKMLYAQALWDAAMAHSIAEHLARHPDALVLQPVGAFHVEGGTGLPEQLRQRRPGTALLTVVIRPAADVTAFDPELRGAGDFVILTDP